MKNADLANLVINTLDEHKALQITDLDVSTLTDLMDRIIVCSATSKRHASALADKVIRRAKENGIRPLGVEGKAEAEWILIDLYDVIVHIMLPEVRDFYNLEKLWSVTETDYQQYEN
ncbi:ribosome silencing factor [Coxiella endosymbiont of Ornithodoros amblus]|uniref:ribosome silencing factor n=1 Tax=Coxiella endosymbiont of Ornithodoros amblus TaxID=1656166 RepID=UPI00244DD9E6|nr:ribosome silencing factor [Coxiella endosymbiont of Ornithodoros amblus]MBW5802386.1 ribosome silencing factor [Coxiella endosymbiont of Ornithodoros amblus]